MYKKIVLLSISVLVAFSVILLSGSSDYIHTNEPDPVVSGLRAPLIFTDVNDVLEHVGMAKFSEFAIPELAPLNIPNDVPVHGFDTLQDITILYEPSYVRGDFELVGVSMFGSSSLTFHHANVADEPANFIWSRSVPYANATAEFFRRGAIAEFYVERNGITFAVSEWVTRETREPDGWVIAWAQNGQSFMASLPASYTEDEILAFCDAQSIVSWELEGNAVSVSVQGMANVSIFEDDEFTARSDRSNTGNEIIVIGNVLYRSGLGRSMERVGYRWRIDEDLHRYQYVLKPGSYTFHAEGVVGKPGLLTMHFESGNIIESINFSEELGNGAISEFSLVVASDSSELIVIPNEHIFQIWTHTELVGAVQYLYNQSIIEETSITQQATIIMMQDFAATGSTITIPEGVDIILTSASGNTFTYTQPNENNRHFNVYGSLTLRNIILCGGFDMYCECCGDEAITRGGIDVPGGHFIMEDGSVIRNSHAWEGGAVMLPFWPAIFDMHGGIIKYSSSSGNGGGGGVSVSWDAIFNMHDGIIRNSSSTGWRGSGGGVRVYEHGTFNMYGGTIHDNYVAWWVSGGGGVSVEEYSIFNMHGGTIHNNHSDNHGGGISVGRYGTFNLYNGTISANRAMGRGGGVYVENNSIFTMNGTSESIVISDNEAASGGGIYLRWTSNEFTFTGGKISNNAAGFSGGGMYIEPSVVVTILEDVIITGNRIDASLIEEEEDYYEYMHALIDIDMWDRMGLISLDTASDMPTLQAMISRAMHYDGGMLGAESFSYIDITPTFWRLRASGGGISLHVDSILNIYGATISNNTADYGGGIWICVSEGGFMGNPFTGMLNIVSGWIVDNHATRYGGGIFTTTAENYLDPMPTHYYDTLNIMPEVEFSGNTAGRGLSTPPSNAAEIMPRASSVSVADHQLNNYDINFVCGNIDSTIVFEVWNNEELRYAVEHIASQGYRQRVTIMMMQDFSTGSEPIHIWEGNNILFTSIPGNTFTYTAQHNHRHFWMEGGTLTLQNVTLCGGIESHNRGGVHVAVDCWRNPRPAHLILEEGSAIVNNAYEGVYLWAIGTLTMRGGVIEGNSEGVNIDGGVFNMYGGIIRNNDATLSGTGSSGVAVHSDGTFNMHGGIIEGNIAVNGGGVNVSGGSTFNMHGGAIRNNQAQEGGGVRVGASLDLWFPNTFNMYGGEIYNNTADYGGGVLIGWWHQLSPTEVINFTMTGGHIRDNHATRDGGGVFIQRANHYQNPMPTNVYSNIVIMPEAQFSGNTAGNGAFMPPSNAADIMPRTSEVSVADHQLNNYDVNFRYGAGIFTQLQVWNHEELESAVEMIASYAQNRQITVIMMQDFNATGGTIVIPTGVDIILTSYTDNVFTYTRTTIGRHFSVNGGRLTLGQNITLSGGEANNTNNSGGVIVRSGGTFTMNNGSVIEHCRWTTPSGDSWMTLGGGAVLLSGHGLTISTRATFNMYGGEIRDNTALLGGGVQIGPNSRMNMSGGSITGNKALTTFMPHYSISSGRGGGVHVNWGTIASDQGFNMIGGSITNNRAGIYGGGVFAGSNSTAAIVPAGAYTNIYIAENAVFAGNTTLRGSSPPPSNALGHIRPSSASIGTHVLNNYDIDYRRQLPDLPGREEGNYIKISIIGIHTFGVQPVGWLRHGALELQGDGIYATLPTGGLRRVGDVHNGCGFGGMVTETVYIIDAGAFNAVITMDPWSPKQLSDQIFVTHVENGVPRLIQHWDNVDYYVHVYLELTAHSAELTEIYHQWNGIWPCSIWLNYEQELSDSNSVRFSTNVIDDIHIFSSLSEYIAIKGIAYEDITADEMLSLYLWLNFGIWHDFSENRFDFDEVYAYFTNYQLNSRMDMSRRTMSLSHQP